VPVLTGLALPGTAASGATDWKSVADKKNALKRVALPPQQASTCFLWQPVNSIHRLEVPRPFSMSQTSPSSQLHDLPAADQPQKRLIQTGAATLSSAELLAILLQKPGRSALMALDLAQQLLSTFDGLPGVAYASLEELTSVSGVGMVKAVEIKAALELGRRLMNIRRDEYPQISSPADAANLLMADMALLEQERLTIILLDTRNRVLRIHNLYVGSLNSATVRVAELFREAIRASAAGLILAHNHPSGDPSPSPEDVRMTREVAQAGELLDIKLLDHLIIGRNRFVSLKERGLGFS
jgi:DNA repair protein RadC